MKRNEIIHRLIQEGMSERTLAAFTDKQINTLAERLIGESMTSTVKNTVYTPSEVSSAKQKGQGFGVKDGTVTLGNDGGITVSTKEGTQEVSEKLIGKQKNIDKNHNGVIDGQDFKILKSKKKNIDAKDKKSEATEAKKKYATCDDCGKPIDKCTCSHEHLDEEKPSAGLSKEKKSAVVKKAKKGEDIGKKGKGFEKVAEKAAKKYGSKEKGEKVAAAAMWKNVKRESDETMWVKNLVENEFFHNFTSKNEIMELIKTKLNENTAMVQHGPQVKKGHNGIPEFMTYDAIVKSDKPAVAPSKPKTKPGTSPGTKPGTNPKPKHPYAPNPGENPEPKASLGENED